MAEKPTYKELQLRVRKLEQMVKEHRLSDPDDPEQYATHGEAVQSRKPTYAAGGFQELKQPGDSGFSGTLTGIADGQSPGQRPLQDPGLQRAATGSGNTELINLNQRLTREIQGRKKMEAALRESETHLRSLMETASHFAVYRLASDAKSSVGLGVVFVSPSIEDLMGIPRTAEHTDWFHTIHPEDLDRVMEATQHAFETTDFNEVFRIVHPLKDEIRWIHAISKGIPGPNNKGLHVNGIFIDVTDQKGAEERIKISERMLKVKTDNLKEVNTALEVLLKRRTDDKLKIESKIMFNIKELVLPYFEKLINSPLDGNQKTLIQIMHSNLQDILSSFSQTLSSLQFNLTPTELQIANLIKMGKNNRDIARVMNQSIRTVETHRKNIRKKLGLRQRKINLRTHLLSLD
jgi:PAS domain S-box-containing protein